MSPQTYRHVGVMIDALNGSGLRILDGITRYAHQQSNWRIAFFDRERKELADLVGNWKGDGIICTATDTRFRDAVLSREATSGQRIPIINVTGRSNDPAFINVIGDDRAAGAAAAKFLLDRGFESFGFIRRRENATFATERSHGFCETITAAGFKAPVFAVGTAGDDELEEWISKLPRPLALATSGDRQASMAIEACFRLGLRVPEEVAILGTGNYEPLCQLCSPTLSSLDLDMERRGFEAAQLLNEIFEGREKPQEPVLIPHAHVVERGSTSSYAFKDNDVVAALRFIRENATRTIHVRDVVAATKISRRSLEGRFNRLIGRTLHDEIWQAHFDLATRLLASSDLSLQQTAERSGFRTASALVNLFRQRFGQTPKEYRVANRR